MCQEFCPQGVAYPSMHWNRTPGADSPSADIPTHPPADPPSLVTAADGTHPTGMHSCYIIFSLRVPGSSPTNVCTHVQVCVSNGLSALLATKRSAGVSLEVNLKNPWHTGIKTHKGGIHPGFETQGRHLPKSKTGISVAPQKNWYSLKMFKKEIYYCSEQSEIGEILSRWRSWVVYFVYTMLFMINCTVINPPFCVRINQW